MDNPEKSQKDNQEWTTQSKTKGAIKNGQPRENQKGNHEWTTQRKPKGFVRNEQP